MIVTCPQCSAKYNVPLTALPPTGRKTRCAACGKIWMEGAPPAAAITAFAAADAIPAPRAIESPADDASPAVSKKTAQKTARAKKPFVWSRVAAGMVCVALTAMGAGLIFRGPIAEAAPAIAPFYELAGLSTGTADDWFERLELKADPFTADQAQGLKISGRYRNISARLRAAPPVRVFWQASDGTVGPLLTVAMAPAEAAPDEVVSFTASLSGMDMSAGGQAGAVLTGDRYDEKLTALLAGQAGLGRKIVSPAAHAAAGHAKPAQEAGASAAHK